MERVEPLPETLETKVKYELPDRFSFTRLRAFETCPLQYWYEFILKLPIKGNASQNFGKSMHATLQKFYALALARSEKKQNDLFGTSQVESPKAIGELVSEKELLDFYQESWIDDWFDSKKQRDDYYNKGLEQLRDYYQKVADEKLNIVAIEKDFNLKLKESIIHGKIDKIEQDADGWRLFDYKTSKPKDKLTWDDKEQLILYQIAVEEVFQQKVSRLTYWYLDNNEPIDFIATDKEKEKLKEKVIKTIEELKDTDWTATPGFHCQYCDFYKICPYRM